MKICFLFLWIPFLLNAETVWLSEENGCSIEIRLVNSHPALFQPVKMQITFTCPPTYELDTRSISTSLWSPGFLSEDWLIGKEEYDSLRTTKEGKILQNLTIEIVPLTKGLLLLSFFDITFRSIKGGLEPVKILTPVLEIPVSDQYLENENKLAPLIALEPKFPLYLSSQNRQKIDLNSGQLQAEQESNIRMLKKHQIPFLWLLLICGVALLYSASVKLFHHIHEKKIKTAGRISINKKAMDELKSLKNSLESNSEPYKSLYLKLVEFCLRQIENRFNQKISFFTDEELKRSLENLPEMPLKTQRGLFDLLNQAQYIKFANTQPSREDCQEAYKISMELTGMK